MKSKDENRQDLIQEVIKLKLQNEDLQSKLGNRNIVLNIMQNENNMLQAREKKEEQLQNELADYK